MSEDQQLSLDDEMVEHDGLDWHEWFIGLLPAQADDSEEREAA